MNSDEKMIVEGIVFDNRKDYEMAVKELETIRAIERKCAVGDAKVALSIYNKAVTNRTFRTIIGYLFLKRLRETIVSCGLVDAAVLKPIPVYGMDAAEESGKIEKRTDDGFSILYRNEKRKNRVITAVTVALVMVIIAMFFITGKSKYSFVTYFTDYENQIRDEVINEYEEWEKELRAREEALEGSHIQE